jgi:hypothetical protein
VQRRPVDQLDAPAVKEGLVADVQGIGSLAHNIYEGGIDLAARTGVDDLDLQAHGTGGRFHLSDRGLGSGTG